MNLKDLKMVVSVGGRPAMKISRFLPGIVAMTLSMGVPSFWEES